MNINLNTFQKGQPESFINKLQTKEEVQEYVFNRIMYKRDEMSEEERAKMMAQIRQKIKNGKVLTAEEARLLQQEDPMLYQQYLRIRAMADGLKERLKHSKTKQEANDAIISAISGVSDKDPYKEEVIAAYNELAKEFKKSPAYNRLPENEEALKRKPHGKDSSDFKTEEEKEEEDLMSWTPLQEIIDGQPKFHVSA